MQHAGSGKTFQSIDELKSDSPGLAVGHTNTNTRSNLNRGHTG